MCKIDKPCLINAKIKILAFGLTISAKFNIWKVIILGNGFCRLEYCFILLFFLISVIKGDPSMEEGDKVLVSGDGKYYKNIS